MSAKVCYLISFILLMIAAAAFMIAFICELVTGMWWLAIIYMVLTSADGILAQRAFKYYIEFKNLEKSMRK